MMTPEEIRSRILEAMPDAQVEVQDLTGGGDHFQVTVVSSGFEGKSLLERHRLVNAALEEEMKGKIHALALKTYTPEQWEKQN